MGTFSLSIKKSRALSLSLSSVDFVVRHSVSCCSLLCYDL